MRHVTGAAVAAHRSFSGARRLTAVSVRLLLFFCSPLPETHSFRERKVPALASRTRRSDSRFHRPRVGEATGRHRSGGRRFLCARRGQEEQTAAADDSTAMNGAFAHSIRNHSTSLAAIASHTIAAIAFFFFLSPSSRPPAPLPPRAHLCSRETKLIAIAAWIFEAASSFVTLQRAEETAAERVGLGRKIGTKSGLPSAKPFSQLQHVARCFAVI